MITDQQVKLLRSTMAKHMNQRIAAAKSGMSSAPALLVKVELFFTSVIQPEVAMKAVSSCCWKQNNWKS